QPTHVSTVMPDAFNDNSNSNFSQYSSFSCNYGTTDQASLSYTDLSNSTSSKFKLDLHSNPLTPVKQISHSMSSNSGNNCNRSNINLDLEFSPIKQSELVSLDEMHKAQQRKLAIPRKRTASNSEELFGNQ